MNPDKTITATRRWLESIVIEFNLCPFAKRELAKNSIRFAATSATNEEQLLQALEEEINHLDSDPSIETSLLIHPQVLQDFDVYNQFLDLADELLVMLGRDGVYQIASFHPDYCFAGCDLDDPENFTNRAPYPLLHLLREQSLERAINSHPDTAEIPQQNIALMNRLGITRLRQLFAACQE
ncbi:MAG: hypothetical protein ACI9LO_002433 [Planctomycetota bacterium]|jgi:hypothetical protein